MEQRLVTPEDERAMRDSIERIFTALPDALTVPSLKTALISAGTYILGDTLTSYPLPTNGKFRALLDNGTIWWNIATISNLIPMYDGSHGVEWDQASEDNWDLIVDSTWKALRELWQENPYHVWYGEELLHAIQERLLRKVNVLQQNVPNIALLKTLAVEKQHPYACLLTFRLKVSRDLANVKIFVIDEGKVVEQAPSAKSPSSAIKRMLGKVKGGKSS